MKIKVTFKAKDIQEIVEISKSRYEYLATKIGISPDVEEVEGTGRSHRYSFKNLLQFAFVHHANESGLTPKASKAMLSALEKFNKLMVQDQETLYLLIEHNIAYTPPPSLKDSEIDKLGAFFGFYTQNEDFGYELSYIRKPNNSVFLLKRNYKNLFSPKKSKNVSMPLGAIFWTEDDGKVQVHKVFDDDNSSEAILEKNFTGAFTLNTINLGTIKRQILSKTKS